MKNLLILIMLVLLLPSIAFATPTTVFWTPFTPSIQPYGVLHTGADAYTSRKLGLPTNYGLTIGVLPYDKVQAEVGIDAFYPAPGVNPFYGNAKIGSPENAWFDGSPGVSLGVLAVGFQRKTTKTAPANNLDTVVLSVGKTINKIGTLSAGLYRGNPKMLTNLTGKAANIGLGIGYYRGLDEITSKIAVVADAMSGDNSFGGAAGGLVFWPSQNVDFIVGYVSLSEPQLAYGAPHKTSPGLWSVQFDVDFDLKTKKPTDGEKAAD